MGIVGAFALLDDPRRGGREALDPARRVAGLPLLLRTLLTLQSQGATHIIVAVSPEHDSARDARGFIVAEHYDGGQIDHAGKSGPFVVRSCFTDY